MSDKVPENSAGMRKEMQSNAEVYKICFVPDCANTTINNPKKVFFSVPRDAAKHNSWRSALETPEKTVKKTKFCCDDHFDLKHDIDNFHEWRDDGVNKRLRRNAVLRRALQFENIPSGSHISHSEFESADESLPSASFDSTTHDCSIKTIQNCPDVEHKHTQADVCTNVEITQTDKILSHPPKCMNHEEIQHVIGSELRDKLRVVTSAVMKLKVSEEDLNETTSSIPIEVFDSSFSYQPSNEPTSTSSLEKGLKLKLVKQSFYENYTKIMIEDDPYLFLGVRKEAIYVLDTLHEMSAISSRDIYLVLKEIRLNQSFNILAYEFSKSKSEAAKISQKNVGLLTQFFKQLIIWPSRKSLRLNLPIRFRYRFSRVESIIDCFEIEIEKPSDAMYQALTWSDYKACNSDKHFISVLGNGLIDYVSKGVCGRATDMSIVENCGYLDVITRGCTVLADRGFKGLDILLQQKKCELMRPPSVYAGKKCSKQEVRLTKQIASLRIHVERVINCIRNDELLNIHTRVDNKLFKYIDSAVYIVCGLVNLDTAIIKQTDM
ncbi:hypothetical protein QAD02_014207 [Eretmocerus hayati]|uniref:Uncharacterized protein n=1 Tax=Eretmocerus hayati TaxID=131215 RepID=A0ACC2P9G1_9HYME|nr:hypothetical protein QAD02_014207 [Eretmocerus hayati]